jgi:Condensation domain
MNGHWHFRYKMEYLHAMVHDASPGGGLSAAKQALLKRWRAGTWSVAGGRITPAPPAHRARGSAQQHELWNLHQRSPGTSSPNISFAANLDAAVDVGALAEAVRQLALRHETLRTTLWAGDDGVVWQDIHDEPLTALSVADLSALGPGRARERALELANAAATQEFDLVNGPLARIMLYRLGPAQHLLAIVVHHSIADGWSLAIAMNETSRLYDALLRGEQADLPALPVQYRDYAEWQWLWVDSPEAQVHAGYWERRISPYRATQIPSDFNQDDRPDFTGGLKNIALSPALCQALDGLATTGQASVFMVLIAAFAVLIHERTGDRVVSIGTPVSCRDRPETRALIGCFASMVPLFVPVPADASFLELLRLVRAEAAAALTHQSYPLDIYLNKVEPERSFATAPLFAAQFGLQPPMQPFTLAGVRLEPVNLDRGETRTPLAVHLWNDGGSIHGTVGYSTALFRRSTVDAMIERYTQIIANAATDPARLVSTL